MFLGLLGVHFTSSGVTPSGILANSVSHPSVPTLRYYVTAHSHRGGGIADSYSSSSNFTSYPLASVFRCFFTISETT